MVAAAAAGPGARLERVAWLLYALAPVVVCARFLFVADPTRQNIYLKVMAPAAAAFRAQGELYTPESGFRYPLAAAAALVPFELCGPVVGSMLWRLCLWAALWLGVRAVFAAGFPRPLDGRGRAAFLLLLLVPAVVNLNMGQPNLLVLGGLLVAAAAFAAPRPRDGLGAFGVAAAAAVKVYPLAFGLVHAALRPRLLRWLLPAVAVVVLVPFALAPASWVVDEYRSLFALLADEDRTQDLANAYRDLRLLAIAVGLPLPGGWFPALQLLGGAAIPLALWWLRRRGAAAAIVHDRAFALVSCWFMLLGPSTEKVTYVLLAPALAWAAIPAAAGARGPRRLLLATAALFVLDHVLPSPSRPYQAEHPWVRCALPFSALLLAVAIAVQLVDDARRARGAGARPGPG